MMTDAERKTIDRCPEKEVREAVLMAHEAFPARLKSLRKGAGLTLKEAGEMTGIYWGQISDYEVGQEKPKFTTLCLLAAFYGVSIDWLIGRDWA